MLNKIVELGYSKREAEELLKVSSNISRDYELLKNKYPIQYCIGYVNFYGNTINVNKNVLIPRFETELLVEKLIKYIKNNFDKNVKILDLCTGSGAIAIALQNELNAIVDASDISRDALEVAIKNNKENNAKVNFIESDLFNNIGSKYDVIVSNPPYISMNEEIEESVKKYEPHLALYADNNGLYFYEEILKNIKDHLNNKFIIAFEIGYTQSEEISKIANKYLENVDIYVEKDYSDKERYIFILSK